MKVDSVPVDTCANLTLVAAWETHKNHTDGKKDLKVGFVGSLYALFLHCTMVKLKNGVKRSQLSTIISPPIFNENLPNFER